MIGWVLLVTMLFFSSLAFTVLENAMSVIFVHRVVIRRRHFMVSAILPYCYIVFLGVGLLLVTLVAGSLQVDGRRAHRLPRLQLVAARAVRRAPVPARRRGRDSRADVDLPGDARRAAVMAARAGRRRHGDRAVGDHPPRPRLVLRDAVAGHRRLRIADDVHRRAAEPRDRGDAAAVRRAGHRRVRAHRHQGRKMLRRRRCTRNGGSMAPARSKRRDGFRPARATRRRAPRRSSGT